MERVLPDSQVGKWNASCGEEYTVEIGDRVIAVNGLRDTSAMQSEMAFARRLFLTVERRELVPQEERVVEDAELVARRRLERVVPEVVHEGERDVQACRGGETWGGVWRMRVGVAWRSTMHRATCA